MKILYDGQIYKNQAAGGINRYFSNIISRLTKDFFPTIITPEIRNFNYPVHPNLKTFSWHKKFRPERIRIAVDKLYSEAINRLNHFDIAHPTYYSLVTRQEIESYQFPIVITVHDMIHELFPKLLTDSSYVIPLKRRAISAATAIICVSENTKKDLLQIYSLPENKISVIYHAPEISISISYGSEPVPIQPYYLYIGNRASYKNFDGLLSAFAKIVSVKPDLRLCVVGLPFNKQEEKLISELKLDNYIKNYGYVSDAHLAKLYRNSVAFVYPSLYEGFGIPPLEAMACRTAVVAANCSSIPEVVGDAGLLFDPQSPHELADILLFLLNSPIERDKLIRKGHQRARLFSWEKTATQTINVYRSVTN
jgi:glycosyltransferase involved in cell wall biosynthesis